MGGARDLADEMSNRNTSAIGASKGLQLDPLRRAIAGCTRAIARKRDLEVVYEPARPSGASSSAVLPMLPKRLNRRDCAVLRGCADSIALRLAYHDPRIGRLLRPLHGESAAIFDALEQARVEIIGARRMAGTAENLFAMLADRYIKPEYAGISVLAEAPIEDALALLVRQRLIGYPMNELSLRLVELWRPFIEGAAGPLLMQLGRCVDDQAAFGRLALDIIAALRDREPRQTPLVIEGPQPDVEAEGEQEPGPIEGGDRSLGHAAGTKSAEEEAIGEEPIYGEAEKAKAPGYDSLANQIDSADLDVSEPSRRADRDSGAAPDDYRIYTSRFDETLRAEEFVSQSELATLRREIDAALGTMDSLVRRLAHRLQRSLLAQQRRVWEHDLEIGTLDTSRLTRVIADPAAVLLYKEERDAPSRDTVLTLLLDNSGSMRGRPSMVAAVCADILACTLERCGVKVELLGFTTRTWRGGRSRQAWLAAGSPSNPGRLNDILHVIYKSADVPWRRTRNNLGLLMLHGFHKENIDGEALAWAHRRLLKRPERRKILIMVSDGAPVDESTLSVATGSGNYLERHLRKTVDEIDRLALVELFAIGIGYDVHRFYSRALKIDDVDELGPALMRQLCVMLDPAHSAAAGPAARRRSIPLPSRLKELA